MKRLYLFSAMCLLALGALAESQPNAVRFEQDNGKDFYTLNATVTMPEAYTGTTITIEGQTYDLSENSVTTYFCEIGTYTRTVNDGDWGTLCLPWQGVKMEGGNYYDVHGTKDAEKGVALVELETTDDLVAGKPYVFRATSGEIKVIYYPETQVDNEVYDDNHLYGSFEGCDVPQDKYIIYNNMLYITDGSSKIGTNRAYFDVASMGAYNPQTAPARVVFFGGRQAPTGFGQWNKEQGQRIMKVVENGQFIIIKDNKMYNAQGIEL
ncbi:MAG: hypothetical protein MJZ58_05760 [Paludibacteraceae bacterium]|nr:hypothetical protein [Paludibacteraceae bacterium]